MPRFPVAFGRRKSTADNIENAPVGPSFRVLDRNEVAVGKSFDGGARLSAKTHHMPKTSVENINVEDNIFADLKPSNRGSGSTNTTKTNSTDNSSRHSNASTAPSSADYGGQEEWKGGVHRKPVPGADIPVPPIPKSASSGFLKSAGRTFSFGSQKKHLPAVPAVDESPASSPTEPDRFTAGRARATTASTATTVVPPKVDEDFNLDLGGDFSKMLLGYDKRASTATMLDEQSGRQALQPRGLTGNRLNQPSPIHIDKTSKVDASPYSWNSQHSNDNLLTSSPVYASPVNENTPPPVPQHTSPLSNTSQFPKPIEGSLKRASAIFGRRKSQAEEGEGDDEEAKLLKDTLSAVNKFMSSGKSSTPNQGANTRYRRNEDTLGSGYRNFSSDSKVSRFNPKDDEDNLFDNNIAQHSRLAQRYVTRKPSPPQNKVMTPAEFERYRKDKERQDAASDTKSEKDDDDDEDHYEDDEDEIEKSKQLAKQRRKQEAHMTVYRQQMMKVTGETSSGIAPSRPSIQMSFSTPNLSNLTVPGPSKNPSSENSDEDEEVPLAILAAHGFPNKNRPPTRLSNMASNPNLREATQPSYQRPGSAAGDASGAATGAAAGSRLPPFARRLPQDPYGLVNPAVRESFALGGGAPAPGQQAPLPPGGLVGVIANEERSRALRRGSPQIDGTRGVPAAGPGGFDPIAGIPPQMMYPQMPQMPALSPGDHAQIQMTQQMQQFMQMQMQFMQMMAANQGGNGPPRSAGHMSAQSMGAPNGMPMPMTGMDMLGQGSFLDNGSMLDLPRPDMHGRTMSMVQPSSASWIQPPNPGYAPSIRIQGDGYAPSIAPSERSNVGLPGRYRPVSHMPPAAGGEHLRKSSTMSGALSGWDETQNRKLANKTPPKKSSGNASDEDDEEGWEAMKAKRDKKKSMWKTKKSLAPTDLGALIS